MLWKSPNPTWCIASVSVQQGLSHRPSLADWRRDCSLEGTGVIPRERYVSPLCPQILENWKIWRFYSYQIPFYSYRIRNYLLALTLPRIRSYRIWNIHTGSEIFIPDPLLILTGSYFVHADPNLLSCCWLFQRVPISSWVDPCLKIICTGSENTKVKPSNWLIS